jgi:hypothetical protein
MMWIFNRGEITVLYLIRVQLATHPTAAGISVREIAVHVLKVVNELVQENGAVEEIALWM